MKLNKKYIMLITAFVLLLVSVIFFIYNIKADAHSNEIGISYAEITGIEDGTPSFNSQDSSNSNRIVRSFDTITYKFDIGIKKKTELTQISGLTGYSSRQVIIKVTLNEVEARYVAFSENGTPGERTHEFILGNINESNGSINQNRQITLYVLGAPNGITIDPKFEIQEATNTDNNYIVSLGSVGNNTHYYRYDALSSENNGFLSQADFVNYMPTTVASSNSSNIRISLDAVESQNANYNNKTGRYINYILSLYFDGSLKGQLMPTGDITMDGSYRQTGHDTNPIMEESFVRLYDGKNVGSILPTTSNKPYSDLSLVSTDKHTRKPGTITVSNINNNTFELKISGYSASYKYPTSNADGTSVGSKNYIGTYAFTLFSPRTAEDGTNNFAVTLMLGGIKYKLSDGTEIRPESLSADGTNSGYVASDYNLVTGLYEMDGTTKIGNANSRGAKSKGSEILYITNFNYSVTNSNQGLKEVIKIDPVAYRFLSISNKNDIDIKAYCGASECEDIDKDDFEVKFVTGDFKASNYTSANYNQSVLDSRIKSGDSATIIAGCSALNNSQTGLSTYNSDQVMNLYGGPCINENNATVYDRINDAITDDGKEIILSKLIVQTKDGVKLPDNVKIVIKTKLRIRNVTDLSKTYQVTAMATSSDYDSKIVYYTPRTNKVVDKGNYDKTNTSILYGDCLRILGFETNQKITVTNKNKDGKMKTNFNAVDNETIHFKVSTDLSDQVRAVGGDDSWYIKDLKFTVKIPNDLTYIPNDNVVNPNRVYTCDTNKTCLEYIIPFSKPNQSVPEIYFDAVLNSRLTGTGKAITVTSTIEGHNINNESVDELNANASLTIYGNGINNMILSLTNNGSTKVEKDSEFSYTINAFNNTSSVINDYTILNVLPFNNDEKGSSFKGSYKVRIESNYLSGANILCSTDDPTSIREEVLDTENTFTECPDILNIDGYKSVTAFKITGISVAAQSNMVPIKVYILPEDNDFSDIYKTSVVGGSQSYMQMKSNELSYEVINRKISGKVFIDVDEDGVQEGNDIDLANIPVSLYKIIDDLNVELVKETTTLKSGAYTFDKLDKGYYMIRLNYDNTLYDLSLRYAIEDTEKDSDAYKLEEGLAEITNKHDPYSHNGIDLVNNIEAKHMDMGLINRRPFSMTIKKYITKVDLNYNGITNTKTYDNQSKVLLSVRNSLKATAKVYYGFEITNNSQMAGYVNNIYENIPEGLLFDSNDPYNEGWVYIDGKLQNTSYQSLKLEPGESIYTQVALNMPTREEAGTFLNKVTLEIIPAEEENIPDDSSIDNDKGYAIGEAVNFAGLSWHVIKKVDAGENQILTMLLDSESATTSGTIQSGPYKWSKVSFNLGGTLKNVTSILEDNVICDDASGLVGGSKGGDLKEYGTCTSGQYVTSKVRLLTLQEYNNIIQMVRNNTITEATWLFGNKDYYLQTASRIPQENMDHIMFYDSSSSNPVIGTVSTSATPKKAFRYVITINSKYILNY